MNRRAFFNNGFIVVLSDDVNVSYRGIDGLHWPLEDENTDWAQFDRAFGIPTDAFLTPNRLGTAVNWEPVFAYWQTCVTRGTHAQLLLVESEAVYPQVVRLPETKWEFLGYDAAQPSGRFSSILHEVLRGQTVLISWASRLNENGLFQTLEQAERFLEERSALLAINTKGLETCGDIVLLRLSRLSG